MGTPKGPHGPKPYSNELNIDYSFVLVSGIMGTPKGPPWGIVGTPKGAHELKPCSNELFFFAGLGFGRGDFPDCWYPEQPLGL